MTASAGNHAQGVAAAAKGVGAPAAIVMPSDSPAVKVEGVRAFGGEVRFYDRWTESREAIGAAIAADRIQIDLGLTAEGLSSLTGSYHIAFALGQIPVGVALDRFGVRPVSLALLAIVCAGTLIAALAGGPAGFLLAQIVLGFGCAGALIAPMTLAAKEGLALLNGTQVSSAYALRGLFEAEDLYAAASVCGALSVEAMLGSRAPFDARIHAARGQRGQIATAAALRELIAGSAIRESHRDNDVRVQDPYCLRCQPQVMGAALDILRQAATTLEIEANGVSDNPLVFTDTGEALSGGNFHAEPVAFAADMLAMAVCEIGSISERRTAMLVDPALSGLPAFLTPRPGLNSGFMIPQVTAAALVSENKQRAFPASVDSIPTSANQEDHVSMAAHGARRLLQMAANAANVVGIELLAAAQGCDFHAPLRSSDALENARTLLRAQVPSLEEDRYFHPDMVAATTLVGSGALAASVGMALPGVATSEATSP